MPTFCSTNCWSSLSTSSSLSSYHLLLLLCLCCCCLSQKVQGWDVAAASSVLSQKLGKTMKSKQAKKRPNVIFILADDLGYGDLGWEPFFSMMMQPVKTPHLRELARSGLTLTNFHVASPICSPSRASILTSIFPWRLGVDFIYSQDKKLDGSEEMDHEQLPLMPNVAMTFRDSGYYTAHVGKWHLGGISLYNIETRRSSQFKDCTVPGILQYGFDEYVSMSEGNGSMRGITQAHKETYARGAKYLFKNDIALTPSDKPEILTDRQTDEAIRVVQEQSAKKQPFFLNLWYDAPHSPWEIIEPFYSQVQRSFERTQLAMYASMIMNMDMNIGRLVQAVKDAGIYEDTLIFFTSDNGPENEAGSPGRFKGRKRLLTEGGIRVPAIVSWPTHIKANSESNAFMMSTDIYPTLADVANIQMPSHIRIDGFSALPLLLDERHSKLNDEPGVSVQSKTVSLPSLKQQAHAQEELLTKHGDERMVMFYTHSIGFPRLTAVQAYGFKLLWNDYEGRKSNNMPPSLRLFDMHHDDVEEQNLLPFLLPLCRHLNASTAATSGWTPIHFHDVTKMVRPILSSSTSFTGAPTTKLLATESDLLRLLKLVNHMHLVEHLFRFQADQDWLLYHQFKDHEIDGSCAIRSVDNSSTLIFQFPLIAPAYCGHDLFNEQQQQSIASNNNNFAKSTVPPSSYYSRCACPLDASSGSPGGSNDMGKGTCTNIWKSTQRKGWRFGTVLEHLTNVGFVADDVVVHINHLLKASRYQSICENSFTKEFRSATTAATTTTSTFAKASSMPSRTTSTLPKHLLPPLEPMLRYDRLAEENTIHDYCHYGLSPSSVFQNNGWASDVVYNANKFSMTATGDNYQHICYQRLHQRHYAAQQQQRQQGPALLFTTINHCGMDAPVLQINYVSMPHPLNLCPHSLDKMMQLSVYPTFRNNIKPVLHYLDDGMMLVLLNELLYGKNETLLKSTVGPKSVGIIDPLYMHTTQDVARHNNVESYFGPVNDTPGAKQNFLSLRNVSACQAQLSWFHPFESRMNGDSLHHMKLFVLPVLRQELWGLFLIHGDFQGAASPFLSQLQLAGKKKKSEKRMFELVYFHSQSLKAEMEEQQRSIRATLECLYPNDDITIHMHDVSIPAHNEISSNSNNNRSNNNNRSLASSGMAVVLYFKYFMQQYKGSETKWSKLTSATSKDTENLFTKLKIDAERNYWYDTWVRRRDETHQRMMAYMNLMSASKFK